MKRIITIISVLLVCSSFNFPPIKKIKDLKLFYHDTVTEKGKDIYRELTELGEDPWAKPDKFDVSVFVNNLNSSSERIEVLIEELYEPSELNKSKNSLRDKRWIPHEVVFSTTGASIQNRKLVKNGKLLIKDIPYAFTGFYDSFLYHKSGIRIVVIYFNQDTKQLERLEREVIIPE